MGHLLEQRGQLLLGAQCGDALAIAAAVGRAHLQRGIDEGRFTVADPSVSLLAMGGALLATVRAVLREHVGVGADVAHATAMLQPVGLAPADAAEVAARPLPPVTPAGGYGSPRR